MDWLFPTSWYHRFLSYCFGKSFQFRAFLPQRRTCDHSLSHKGYNNHKSNDRFSAIWTLLCLPGTMSTPNIISLLLLAHNSPAWFDHYLKHLPLSPPNFLHLASSLMKLVVLFHLLWDEWLRPGYFSLWRQHSFFIIVGAITHVLHFPLWPSPCCLCPWAMHMHFCSLANLF